MSESPTREIISPEGVEERVLTEYTFRITLTGGGKYRLYAIRPDEKPHSIAVVDSLEEANKLLGALIALTGTVIHDPSKTSLIQLMIQRATQIPPEKQ